MDDNSADIGLRGGSDPTNYGFSGKVMLATVLILSVVCIIVAFFHIYSRWYLSRHSTASRQYPLHHHTTTTTTVTTPQPGLDPAILKSLPTFTYSPTTTATAPLDCAICLSEFEELETGRVLPKCNHCFHLECIDMWFHSHTNCPLCRSPVQSIPVKYQLTESPIGETSDVLTVIVEVPVTTERETDFVPESEGGNRFKPMVGPTRSLRRFLSI